MGHMKALPISRLNIFQNIIEEQNRIQGNTQRVSNVLERLWLRFTETHFMGCENTLKRRPYHWEHGRPCGMVRGIGIGQCITGKLAPGRLQHESRLGDLTHKNCIPALSDSGMIILQLKNRRQMEKIFSRCDFTPFVLLVAGIIGKHMLHL